MAACPRCGTENPIPRALLQHVWIRIREVSTSPSAEARKTVTVLFCDVVGSTAIGEHQDPESVRGVMSRYFEEARAVLERHGGTVEKFIGDAVMAVFGIPRLHEDDALRAVRAAVEHAGARSRALNEELERALGRPDRGAHRRQHRRGGRRRSRRRPVLRRLATRSTSPPGSSRRRRPGEILLGEPTYRLVARRGRGRAGRAARAQGQGASRVRAYRLLEVMPRCGAGRPPPATRRWSGGSGSSSAVRLRVRRARSSERALRLVTLLGAAGVGKSRLARGARRPRSPGARGRCRAAACRTARASPSGRSPRSCRSRPPTIDDPAVAPDEAPATQVEALAGGERRRARRRSVIGRSRAQVADRGDLLGASAGSSRRSPRSGRSCVVLDDLHWAEPTLLDLLEYLAGSIARRADPAPLPGAPELLELRDRAGRRQANATHAPARAARRRRGRALVDEPARRRDARAAAAASSLESGRGQPALRRGTLHARRRAAAPTTARWHGRSRAAVPPTIQALARRPPRPARARTSAR